jgi:hypothetical protein
MQRIRIIKWIKHNDKVGKRTLLFMDANQLKTFMWILFGEILVPIWGTIASQQLEDQEKLLTILWGQHGDRSYVVF